MKKKICRFLKIFIGYIVAANGSILLGSGIVCVYEFIVLCVEKGKDIFEASHFSIIGYISFDYIYIFGLTFIIVGIYTISKGAKLVGVRTIKKI